MTGGAEFLERMLRLQHNGTPFAVATVVSRRPPVSAHLGDRALILADGDIDGFVGGACSREIVRQQALEALRLRQPRLVTISPDATETASEPAQVMVPMICASEGAIEVYIEPFMPPPALVVVGETPVAGALARLGRAMDYVVTQVVESREQSDIPAMAEPQGISVISLDALEEALRTGLGRPSVVVASQGHYDEDALEVALRAGSPYIGLLASRPRGASVRASLADRGVPGVDAIYSPVGLDLGARTPEEVALSILAEIVRDRPSLSTSPKAPLECHARAKAGAEPTVPANASAPARRDVMTPEYAVDPVCGMKVDIATARQTAELVAVVYYFCCAHCKAALLEKPPQYLRARS